MIWKEAVVVSFKDYYIIGIEKLRKPTKNVNKDSLNPDLRNCSGDDSYVSLFNYLAAHKCPYLII
jgi:hypothetical protein